jgi:hypothetical protein
LPPSNFWHSGSSSPIAQYKKRMPASGAGCRPSPCSIRAGRQVEVSGKKQYAAMLKWRDRARSDRFSDRVELVRQQYPDDLEDGAR